MIYYIRCLYVIVILIWLVVLFYLPINDLVELFILCIPFLVFILAYLTCPYIPRDVEEMLFDVNYISIAILVMVPLLTWLNKGYEGKNRHRFITTIIAAVMLALISLIDIWATRRWITLIKHFKSICETLAVILIIYALYTFYIEAPKSMLQN